MSFASDAVTIFLGVATLLALSIYTIVSCRAQITRPPTSDRVFLFQGLTQRYSLAGTMGAAFSLTYYGATTIFGHLYRGWFILLLLVAFPICLALARCIIHRAHQTLPSPPSTTSHLLFDFLRHRIGKDNLRYLATVYTLIYFGLLVEELAVSRLVISLAFPGHPIVTALLLATLCLVILVYLTWGGFKALLIADFEQIKLLLPFLLAICFLVYRTLGDVSPLPPFQLETRLHVLTLPLSLLLFVAWIIAAVDFYSRLNFETHQKREGLLLVQHKTFAAVSLVLLFIVFLSGGLFGAALPESFSSVETPSGLTRSGIAHAMANGSPITLVIFFASLFCMIFTTVNTLLFTLLQVGYFQPKSPFSPARLSRTLLFAVLLSCAVPADSMSCIGMFVSALMLIPFSIIVSQMNKSLVNILPRRYAFLLWALVLATIVFALLYRELEHYSQHFWLSAIVGSSLLVTGGAARLIEFLAALR